MPGIDETRTFLPLSIAVITISHTHSEQSDSAGALLIEKLTAAGHKLALRQTVHDEEAVISRTLQRCIDDPAIQVVITSGGTGVTGRDVTPEAFHRVIDKEIPGFGELFRMLSYAQIGTASVQSRALAGVAHGTFLFALPGSADACRDAWDWILATQLDSRYRPCNVAELFHRLRKE